MARDSHSSLRDFKTPSPAVTGSFMRPFALIDQATMYLWTLDVSTAELPRGESVVEGGVTGAVTELIRMRNEEAGGSNPAIPTPKTPDQRPFAIKSQWSLMYQLRDYEISSRGSPRVGSGAALTTAVGCLWCRVGWS